MASIKPMRNRIALLTLFIFVAAGILWVSIPQKVHDDEYGIELVWIPTGSFDMGDAHGNGYPEDGERPVHRVTLDGFWIGKYEITNEQFARFTDDTGYRTDAEKFGWSGVPAYLLGEKVDAEFPADVQGRWESHWRKVDGADWRHPTGPDSSISERVNHPAVHISWNDANVYCRWLSGKSGNKYRLPTEAEWEYAARGGIEKANMPWGDDFNPGGKLGANLWQGTWPNENTAEDGFLSTAPVGSFQVNGFGLYDVSGNVWEWCGDWFDPNYYRISPNKSPTGPKVGLSRVQRGGSYLCCDACCRRYRVAARFSNDPDSGMANTGFRVVRE